MFYSENTTLFPPTIESVSNRVNFVMQHALGPGDPRILLPPQGFGPDAKTRGGIIETPA